MNFMKFTSGLLAGLLLTGIWRSRRIHRSLMEGAVAAVTLEGVVGAATLGAVATLEDFTAALPVRDSRTGDVMTLRGITVPVGPTMGTVGTTGITVHMITNHLMPGLMIIMAMLTRTMAMTTLSMCSPLRAASRPRSRPRTRSQYRES